MNKARRKRLAELKVQLEMIRSELEDVISDEEMANDSMIDGSPRRDESDDAIDAMEDAVSAIESAMDEVEDAMDYLSDAAGGKI